MFGAFFLGCAVGLVLGWGGKVVWDAPTEMDRG